MAKLVEYLDLKNYKVIKLHYLCVVFLSISQNYHIMKQIFFIALVFTLFAPSCTNDTKPAAGTPVTVVEPTATTQPKTKTTTGKGLTPAKRLYDVGQEHFFTVLAREYWVFEHYIDKGRPQNKEHTGDWFHFNPDGTYTSGRWEEETGSGVWKLTYREGRNFLDINSTNNEEDAEYALMFNKDDSAASWTGTEMYPSHSEVMLKAIPLSSMPTKKQFHFKY